jgi:hypothetical protein
MTITDQQAPTSASASEPAGEQREPSHEQRRILTSLLAAAGLGALAAAFSRSNEGPEISRDPTPRAPRPGAYVSSIRWVSSIGDAYPGTGQPPNLRALDTAAPNDVVVALGFWTEGDGGGGVFFWDASDHVDDGGTFIIPGPQIGIYANSPSHAPNSWDVYGRPQTDTQGALFYHHGPGWRRLFTGSMDVRWFGARCDGTTDDTYALVRALCAIPGTGGQLVISGMMRLEFPPTSSEFNYCAGAPGAGIRGKQDVSIVGLGPSCGFVLGDDPALLDSNATILSVVNCRRVEIRGLRIEANGKAISHIRFDSVFDSMVVDCVFTSALGLPFAKWGGIKSSLGRNNIYRGNYFRGGYNAFVLGRPDAADYRWDGGPLNLVTGKEEDPVSGQSTDVYGYFEESCPIVAENLITDVGDSGIFFYGDHLTFADNVLMGNVVGVNLFGKAFADGGQICSSYVNISRNVFTQGSGVPLRQDDIGGVVNHHDWTISDNVITGNGTGWTLGAAAWIYFLNAANLTFSNNLVRNNGAGQANPDPANNHAPPGSQILPGLMLSSCDRALVVGNAIVDGRTTPYQGPAINLDMAGEAILVANNVIDNPAATGINLGPVQDAVVIGNTIRRAPSGIYDIGGLRLTIAGNQIVDCGLGARLMGGGFVTVTDNVFVGTDTIGLSVSGSDAFLAGNVWSGGADDPTTPCGDIDPSWASAVVRSNADAYGTVVTTHGALDPYLVVSGDGTQKVARAGAHPTGASTILWQPGDIVWNTAVGASPVGWVYRVYQGSAIWSAIG